MAAFKGIWTKDFWRAVSGEYLATLIFVLLGVGSTINWGAGKENPPPADLVLISLCFGLGIATMVQCFSHISGGHVNPAVTVAMVVTRRLSLAKAVFYVAAQCIGAVTGAGILYLVTPADVRGGLGVTLVNSKLSPGHGLVVELLLTFQLVFTVFASCDPKRTDLAGSAGLAIGLAVTFGHLFAPSSPVKVNTNNVVQTAPHNGVPVLAMSIKCEVTELLREHPMALKGEIPYTGASMNPARSFGPAVITLNFQDHWVYWIGPVLGAALAAAFYEYLYCPDPDMKKRLQHAFQKDQSGKYMEVEEGAGDVAIKPGSVHAVDLKKAEKRGPFVDSSGEVLSSV